MVSEETKAADRKSVELLNEPCAGAWGYYPVGGCSIIDAVWFKSEQARDSDIVEKGFVVAN